MIDREGHYVGTVTEGDILWTLKKRYNMNLKEAENVPVTSVERRIPFKPVSIDATMEDLVQMANRQQKFIQGLEAALVRIENKTYGIDRITGELIPKERLRAVPHATLSVASKNARKK